jgi:hypothetical protein
MEFIASYADFKIVGLLHFFKVVDQPTYERVLKTEPVYGKLYEACQKWLDRDEH